MKKTTTQTTAYNKIKEQEKKKEKHAKKTYG